MALELPIRFDLSSTARLSKSDAVRLFRYAEELESGEFQSWMLVTIGEQLLRKSGRAVEPKFGPVPITNGAELSKAFRSIRQLQTKAMSRNAKYFITEVSIHINGMIEAALELFTEQIADGLSSRRNNTTTSMLLPSEVAAAIGISDGTLRKMVDDGSFPKPLRIGSKRYWTESSVQNFINRQADQSANEG
jgi:predicted DNA-binding transcriptional regulator AlpA